MSEEKESSKERLLFIIDHLKSNPNRLSTEMGLKNNVNVYNVKSGKNNISGEFAKMLVNRYPEFRYDWVAFGELPRFKEEEPAEPKSREAEMEGRISELRRMLKMQEDIHTKRIESLVKTLR